MLLNFWTKLADTFDQIALTCHIEQCIKRVFKDDVSLAKTLESSLCTEGETPFADTGNFYKFTYNIVM